MTLSDVTVLLVPGLRGHVPDHWQTHLQASLPRAVTVPPLETNGLNRAARVENFATTLAGVTGPVLLVAHSAGCMIVAHWVAMGGSDSKIAGAFLATPADIETPLPEGYPTLSALLDNGWLPAPRAPLPFPTIVGASRNDPLATFERVSDFARLWGADIADLGDVGHLNPAAGYGKWMAAEVHIGTVLERPTR